METSRWKMELPDALTCRGHLSVTGSLVYDILSLRVGKTAMRSENLSWFRNERLKTRHNR